MEDRQNAKIAVLAILSCAMLYFIEQVLQANYLWKTMAKVSLFLLVPLIFIHFVIRMPILKFLNLKAIDVKNLRLGFLFGLLSMGIVIAAFFLFQPLIDGGAILDDLIERQQITKEIFIFIAIYITFVNSLLEEFYFRGFLFLNFYEKGNPLFSYVFSALLFAVYHVAIFATWFNIGITFLALLGLFIAGLLLNWLNTKSKNFLNSWIFHIFADIGVMIIGFYLFGFFG